MNNKHLRKNPYEIRPIPEEISIQLKKSGNKFDVDQVGPKKYMVWPCYRKYKDEIYNFSIKTNDVWVITFGRSGTTMMTEMVWQIANNMDFKTGFKVPLIARVPYFEFPLANDHRKESLLKEHKNDPEKLTTLNSILTPEWEKTEYPETRIYKCHLPISLLPPELPKEGKILYVVRNPKDTAVSSYHFSKNFSDQPPFEQYWDLFEKGLLWSTFFDHCLEAWNIRNQENVLFLFYEDIVKDMRSTILKVCKFLGKSYSDAEINKLVEHMKFDNFKKNNSVNKDYSDFFPKSDRDFVRQGKVDSYKELFTKELNERANKWIRENYLKTDMRFPTMPE
ncbi:unnamed protein product [Brassicogethes aeneus]|uniref:Sulfotransferase domain-containing protein n=1 Tax=Brassicogethes aeneus TaxID=1431903 RepID=A0A9P0FH02_BRAAE|nr:unnamed protein product [Brassicogethes aeneus]